MRTLQIFPLSPRYGRILLHFPLILPNCTPRPVYAGILFLLATLLLAACSNSAFIIEMERIAAQSQQANIIPEPANRLLVQGIDGNLYTMRPDGTEKFFLTNDASSRRQYLQPTWSPAAEQIAWTAIVADGSETQSELVISSYDGVVQNRYETPFPPFYLFWSPDGARLAYLSNWLTLNEPSLALRIVELAAENEPVKTLAEGQPLYFSWSPDSTRILTHIGNERVELQSLDGEQVSLLTTSAFFPAPQWSNDGERLIYAVNDDAGQRLVVAGPDGIESQEITDFDTRISFTLNASGNHLAYVITPETIGTAAFGPLYVVDVDGGATRELSNSPVVGFFWSPDGQKLAYLATDIADDTVRLRWFVWDGKESVPYATIVPSRTFLQSYLAFMDQYAQSMTLWSPDSNAFVYAGIDAQNRRGIWVQTLAEDEPAWVGRGVFVAWSPK